MVQSLGDIRRELEQEREGKCDWAGAFLPSQLMNNRPERTCVVTCPGCLQEVTLTPLNKMTYGWLVEDHEVPI